jgi:SAM-dependent methyltransferase
MTSLPSGVPSLTAYDALLGTEAFRSLRAAASEFLALHADLLASYRRRWVPDPLHQWSRQWEYPYAWERIEERTRRSGHSPVRVLDAGSGVTFFPYLLSRRLDVEVTCVDNDQRLVSPHRQLRQRTGASVAFKAADLRRLPEPDACFDIAYCLSVLEHTAGRHDIVSELSRVLRPGGMLVVSFDIAPDADSDISLADAELLLRSLRDAFPRGDALDADSLSAAAKAPGSLSTLAIAERDRTLMPWPHPLVCLLRTLRKGLLPRRLGYTNLTCACYSVARP